MDMKDSSINEGAYFFNNKILDYFTAKDPLSERLWKISTARIWLKVKVDGGVGLTLAVRVGIV